MIDALQRFVLMYDVHLRTARQATEMPSLKEIAPALIQRVQDGKARLDLPAYSEGPVVSPWLRIKQAKIVDRNGQQYLAMLFSLGDPRGANPAFEHAKTNKLRVVEKKEFEGKSVTAHSLIALSSHGDANHKMMVEDVRGLGRTRLQDLLRQEFRAISEEFGLEYVNNAKKPVDTWIIPELRGYASEKVSAALERSTISGVYLTGPADPDMDEIEGAKPTSKQIRFTVSDESALARVKAWAMKHDYDRMRLTWNDPESLGRPSSASVDITQKDVQDTFYVKQRKISLSSSLAEACENLADDMIDKMLAVRD